MYAGTSLQRKLPFALASHWQKSISLLLLASSLAGCGYIAKPTEHIEVTTDPSLAAPDSYATIRSEILSSKCLYCHTTGYSYGDFSTYSGILTKISPGNPGASVLYNRVNGYSSTMPPSGREQEIATRVYNWILSGAPETL